VRKSLAILWVTFNALFVSGATLRFAIIGDYGTDNADELAVANLVKTNFQPEFIVTVGDNNYIGATNIDRAIGKYYHQFIGNYTGSYGAGASSNRFFPALGNHDWYSAGGYSAHTNYFKLPGNERYYDFVRGPVHFFILNTDPNEPHGTSATSLQALWLSNRLAASTSPWRIAIAQDPPYSSTEGHAYMRWPFDEWGASAVVSGDCHHYERIAINGFPYLVNGAGGAGLAGFGTPISGSVLRYNADHGAMLVNATHTNITYEFWSVAGGGTRIDRFTQSTPRLSVTTVSNNLVRVSWLTNGADGCVLQSASQLPALWSTVPQTPVISGNRNTVTLSCTGQAKFFRLMR
jgi:tartrate-resistant acid phosphatase type 5